MVHRSDDRPTARRFVEPARGRRHRRGARRSCSATSSPARGSTARATSSSVSAWAPCSPSPTSSARWRSTRSRSSLESPIHEARAGAVKIMAKQAAARTTTDDERRALVELYLRRIDRINNWDLVDLGAWDVVGRLPRRQATRRCSANSPDQSNLWERRTADPRHALLRPARRPRRRVRDRRAIARTTTRTSSTRRSAACCASAASTTGRGSIAFLDEHAASMPRTALRYAIEHLDPATRTHYRSLPRPRTDHDHRGHDRRSSSSPVPAAARSTGTDSSPNWTGGACQRGGRAAGGRRAGRPARIRRGGARRDRRTRRRRSSSSRSHSVGSPGRSCARSDAVERLVMVNTMIPLPGETPGAWWGATGQAEARRRLARRAGARRSRRPVHRLLPRRAPRRRGRRCCANRNRVRGTGRSGNRCSSIGGPMCRPR